MVEISSKMTISTNGKRLYKSSSIVIHFTHMSTMLATIATTKEVIATSLEIGGGGKPSTMIENDSSQRGSRLARVMLQERAGVVRISLVISISLNLL